MDDAVDVGKTDVNVEIVTKINSQLDQDIDLTIITF